jgi:hypothetical protein
MAQTNSADDLARRTIEHRSVEAVVWGMPADVPPYTPTKALFDKAWKLPDVEEVK